jgi:hypothetical protein
VTMPDRLRSAIVPSVMSATVACIFGAAAWQLLPYEAFERQTPEAQFLLWESIMWMTGLVLSFFGLAAVFESTDLYAHPGDPYLNRAAEHVRIQLQQGVRGRLLFSDLPSVPWSMIGIGLAFLLVATVVRYLTA